MRIKRIFEIKWYHLLIAIFGLVATFFLIAWFFLSRSGSRYFVEDETDIVG